MTWPLRYNTASQEIPLGPFVDKTDGNTPETALTIANTDIKLQKYGATSQTNKNSGGATHIATGDYYAVLDATDTDTLGPMRVKVHISADALPVWLDCCVYPANVFDSMILNTEWLEVSGARATFDTTGGTLTVKKKDGTTTQYTKTLSTNAAADPIVGSS